MTHAEIDKIVEGWVGKVTGLVKSGEADRDEPHDAIFAAVDEGWGELGFPVGLIDAWPINPGGEVLRLLGDVLDYCEESGWIEDDSGLWEGLHGAAVMGCQAFHSLQNVVWQKLGDRNIIS